MWYCADCSIVEVAVDGEYCDNCIDEIVTALHAEYGDSEYAHVSQQMNLAYLKYEDIRYSDYAN